MKIFRVLKKIKNWPHVILCKIVGKNPTRVVLNDGMVISAPANNTILAMIREIFIDRVYTPYGLDIEKNDVVVDVGANIGLFALYAAAMTRNKVYAFEPFPENVAYIAQNIATNSINNIIYEQTAISDKIGIAKLYLGAISGGHVLFDNTITGQSRNYIEVPTRTLDQVMSMYVLERIDFLKMDCEGSEGHILQAAMNGSLNKIRKIAMEFHDDISIISHDKIQQLLEDNGFDTWLQWDGLSGIGYVYAIHRE